MTQSLTEVVPQILAQGLVALRENSVMPRLVNSAYSPVPGVKGSSVDVPISSAITANAVVPATTGQAVTDLSPTSVTITLDQWYEAAFTLDDQEKTQAMSGLVPMQVTEAAKALANNVDAALMAKYPGIYGFAGTAGTTPFASDLSAAINARRELARNLAPMSPRYVVIDEDAEATALNLRNFQDVSYRGDNSGNVMGQIGHTIGADWHMDQNVTSHTAGTLENGAGTKTALVNVALAAGVQTMNVDHTTLTGTVEIGDVFSFAGHSGTYVATNRTTAAGNAITGITFNPALRAIAANNEVITFQDDHAVNLFFHRDAFALATRPLDDNDASELGSIIQSAVDPVSGLTLRLEVNRQHKQTRFAFDILYGVQLVRAQLAARILG